jgi:hypothetical protein
VEKAIARSTNIATSIAQEEPHPNFYSTPFNGGKSIVFNFPADQSLGKIGNLHLKMRKEAKGQTILKVNGKICLLANEYLCAHPSLIDLFRPDDLWSFSIPLTYGQAIDTKPIMPHLAKTGEPWRSQSKSKQSRQLNSSLSRKATKAAVSKC